jgi:hypothetical protein
MPVEIREASGVIVDPTPDTRGNVMMAATIAGGRTVALTLNAN